MFAIIALLFSKPIRLELGQKPRFLELPTTKIQENKKSK